MPSTPQSRLFLTGLRHTAKSSKYISVEAEPEPAFQPGETPIFDKTRHRPIPRPRHEEYECSRNANDARPGRSVTAKLLGDPDPDRFARSEQVRKIIAERDAKTKIEGSHDARPPRGPQSQSRTPVIDQPPRRYMPPQPQHRNIEARRGEHVLHFPTVSEAARCFVGRSDDNKATKAISNALGGITKSAYGWEWARLKASRRGPKL